jgi:hypothetical protein
MLVHRSVRFHGFGKKTTETATHTGGKEVATSESRKGVTLFSVETCFVYRTAASVPR